MKRRYSIALISAGILFLLLFAARFAVELGKKPAVQLPFGNPGNMAVQQDYSEAPSASLRKNYASEKVQVGPGSSQQVLDQKYEQVAELSSASGDFDADSRRVREAAAAARAVIQRENSWGLEGSRTLSLTLGVVPETFDAAVAALRGIGELRSATVRKTDRTGEFRALEARRLSLEKTRDGLRALRVTGALLADLVALETKILEIEGQIQELGVSLGDFSESNSFCTVDVTLVETAPGALGGRILRAAVAALGWALLVELGIAALALAATGIAALGVLAWSRLSKGA